ncbi:MAG: hypothetical protein ACR2KJ_08735 [Jatrophihabitans sp.]
MNCPVCGRAVQPGDAFCGTCGAALAPTAQPPAHQAPAEQQPVTQQIEPVDPAPQHAAEAPPASQPAAQFRPTPWAQPSPYQEAPYQEAPFQQSPSQQAPYPEGGYPPPGQPYPQPQAYQEQPSVAEDLLSEEPDYAEPADPNYPGDYYAVEASEDRTTKWIVGGIVAVLAFAAIVLSGLALIKRSRHDSNGERSSTSGSAGKSAESTSSGKSSSSAPTKTPPKPVRSVTISGASSGTKYTVAIWSEDTQKDCAAHSYGKAVVAYLKKYPCSSMTRRVGTTTVNGKPVGFALTVITIPGTSGHPQKPAGDFLKLVSKDGTGNVNDLLREGKRLPTGPTAVPSPDAFSVANKSADVIIVDAWYLSGKTPGNDPPLTKLAADFFQQKGVG